MAQRRHLQHAPITEALVDLRAAPTVEFGGGEVLDRLKSSLSDRYPKYSERRAFEARLEVRKGQALVPKGTDKGLHGHFFESEDGRNIAQFRVDGFTYNRLAPYTDGDYLITEALRLWELHAEVARPLMVSRVALRYINILKLPAQADIRTVLTRVPATPEGSPGRVQGFLTRVETLDAESGRRVITTQALAPGMPPDRVNVVIDIDAFQMGDFGVSPAALRPTLDELRELKNAVFFGSITEQAAEGFE
jgi:uncharacterized protein (TIGR04255 family)